MRAEVPLYWQVLLRRFLGAEEDFSLRLWHAFQPQCTTAIRWQLDLASTSPTVERQTQVLKFLPPRVLLEASERLCMPGKRRAKALIAFQERLLRQTDKVGGWR